MLCSSSVLDVASIRDCISMHSSCNACQRGREVGGGDGRIASHLSVLSLLHKASFASSTTLMIFAVFSRAAKKLRSTKVAEQLKTIGQSDSPTTK